MGERKVENYMVSVLGCKGSFWRGAALSRWEVLRPGSLGKPGGAHSALGVVAVIVIVCVTSIPFSKTDKQKTCLLPNSLDKEPVSPGL